MAVTERDEPQAVIGSKLHRLAYPDYHAKHVGRGMELGESYHHDGTVNAVQLRGEYLYAACGKDGFVAYDVANIDNKGFSERIITAPVSPLGQRFYVRTKDATSVCSPSTMAIEDNTAELGMQDEQTYGLNSKIQISNLGLQAEEDQQAGGAAGLIGWLGGAGSLLGGAGKIYGVVKGGG